MKYSAEITDKVSLLVRYHMFPIDLSDKGLRRLVAKVGRDNIMDLIELKIADIMATKHDHNELGMINGIKRRAWDLINNTKNAFSVKDWRSTAVMLSGS